MSTTVPQRGTRISSTATTRVASSDVTLLDLLDRLLAGGIVVQGDITLAAADIDLVNLSLRLVVGSVDAVGRDLRGPLQSRERAR
jgi:hypothetical protein